MTVDITDVRFFDSRVFDCAVDCLNLAESVFTWSCDVVCIACYACAKDFAVNLCVALFCMFIRLNDNDTCTFAKSDSLAAVERRTSVFIKGME